MKIKALKKILIWWFFAAIFGYLSGAVYVTLVEGFDIEVYIFGFWIAGMLAIFMLPIFSALAALWVWLSCKYKGFDKKSGLVFIFSILIGLIAAVVLTLLLDGNFNSDGFVFITGFFGGFGGTFFPRLIFKSLKPGKLIK
jgi:hypothetical protein